MLLKLHLIQSWWNRCPVCLNFLSVSRVLPFCLCIHIASQAFRTWDYLFGYAFPILVTMSGGTQSCVLQLVCEQDLPGSLFHLKKGTYHYQKKDYGYTHDTYNARLVPSNMNDGCLWTFSISSNDIMWCRTYYSCSPCNGWLAYIGGARGEQQWFGELWKTFCITSK